MKLLDKYITVTDMGYFKLKVHKSLKQGIKQTLLMKLHEDQNPILQKTQTWENLPYMILKLQYTNIE